MQRRDATARGVLSAGGCLRLQRRARRCSYGSAAPSPRRAAKWTPKRFRPRHDPHVATHDSAVSSCALWFEVEEQRGLVRPSTHERTDVRVTARQPRVPLEFRFLAWRRGGRVYRTGVVIAKRDTHAGSPPRRHSRRRIHLRTDARARAQYYARRQHTTSEVDPGATTALSWGATTSGQTQTRQAEQKLP